MVQTSKSLTGLALSSTSVQTLPTLTAPLFRRHWNPAPLHEVPPPAPDVRSHWVKLNAVYAPDTRTFDGGVFAPAQQRRRASGNWGLGEGRRRSGRIFLRNKQRVPRSWLRGSGRVGPGRRSCCGSRRGGCDGGRAGAHHSRRGRPRQPAVLVHESAAAAAAARALHERAAAATGAVAPAVFGPRGGTRIRLPGGRRLPGAETPSAAQSSSPRPAVPGALRGRCPRPAFDTGFCFGDPPALRSQCSAPGLPGCGGQGQGQGQGGRGRGLSWVPAALPAGAALSPLLPTPEPRALGGGARGCFSIISER